MLNLVEGTKAVLFARQILEEYVKHEENSPPNLEKSFHQKQGVFVTLHTFPDHEL
jgi:AMMECR1 domain-containing protein